MQEEIQNNLIGHIGPIPIARVTPNIKNYITAKAQKHALEDILFIFANLEPRTNDIERFCKKYSYFPSEYLPTWEASFIKTQSEIKNLMVKYAKNQLKREDYFFIEKRLEEMNTKDRVVSKEKLLELNQYLNKQHSTEVPSISDSLSFISVPEYTNSEMAMWHRLKKFISSNKKLKQCAENRSCRRFFTPNKHKPNQIYCTPQCEDRDRKSKTK